MMDDISGYMKMLLSFIGSGQNVYSPVRYKNATPGFFSQTGIYKEGIINSFILSMLPGMQRLAPPIYTQYDWDTDIMRKSGMAMRPPGLNPVAMRTMQLALNQVSGGMGDSFLKQMKKHGGMFSMAMPFLFGAGAEGEKGEVQSELYRSLSGPRFVRGTSGMRHYGGISGSDLSGLVNNLFSATYKGDTGTDLLKKFPNFKMTDMSDIMRMGLDYGMGLPVDKAGNINKEELISRTKKLAYAVDAGMAVYHTMDKEKVLKNVLELTRGAMPLSNIGNIESLIYRVKSTAKTYGVAVQYLQEIGTEAAKLFENFGIKGVGGARAAISVEGMTQMVRSSLPASEVAKMGGVGGVRRNVVSNLAEYLGSSSYARYSMHLAAIRDNIDLGFTEEILLSDFTSGKAPANIDNEIRKKLTDKYSKIYSGAALANIVSGKMKAYRASGKSMLADLATSRGRFGDQTITIAQSRSMLRHIGDALNIDNFSDKPEEEAKAQIINYLTSYQGRSIEEAISTANTLWASKSIPEKTLMDTARKISYDEFNTRHHQRTREERGLFHKIKVAISDTKESSKYDNKLFNIITSKGLAAIKPDMSHLMGRSIDELRKILIDNTPMMSPYDLVSESDMPGIDTRRNFIRTISGLSGDAIKVLSPTQWDKIISGMKKGTMPISEAAKKLGFDIKDIKSKFGDGKEKLTLSALAQMKGMSISGFISSQSENIDAFYSLYKEYNPQDADFFSKTQKDDIFSAGYGKRVEDIATKNLKDVARDPRSVLAIRAMMAKKIHEELTAEGKRRRETKEEFVTSAESTLLGAKDKIKYFSDLVSGKNLEKEVSQRMLKRVGLEKEELPLFAEAIASGDSEKRKGILRSIFAKNVDYSNIDIGDIVKHTKSIYGTKFTDLVQKEFKKTEDEKAKSDKVSQSAVDTANNTKKTSDNAEEIKKTINKISESIASLGFSLNKSIAVGG